MSRKHFYLLLKILVSVVIFYFIFRRIKLQFVLQTLQASNICFLIAGLTVGYLMQILLGSVRWHYALTRLFKENYRFKELIKVYWEGMFAGYFFPAGIGWDVYRIVEGKKIKLNRTNNIITIIWEKILGLLSCALLFFISYPLLKVSIINPGARVILDKIWFAGVIATILVLILFFITTKISAFKRLKNAIINFSLSIIQTVTVRILKLPINETDRNSFFDKFFQILNYHGLVLFLLSVLLKLFSAIGTILFFYAIGIQISFIMAVFAASIIIIIHMLPISFGSLGIREGSFIVIFGLFGIMAEYSLAVSFMGLFSLLFTISIGGLFIIVSGSRDIFTRKKRI